MAEVKDESPGVEAELPTKNTEITPLAEDSTYYDEDKVSTGTESEHKEFKDNEVYHPNTQTPTQHVVKGFCSKHKMYYHYFSLMVIHYDLTKISVKQGLKNYVGKVLIG